MKQYAQLGGYPLLEWSLTMAATACSKSVLVLPAGDVDDASWPADVTVAGGATRSASVRAGLVAVPPRAEVIVVHDAARPLATLRVWEEVIRAVERGADAAVPAVAVTDTVKQVCPDGSLRTLDRSGLVAVQTPQAFRASILRSVHDSGDDATDDAALVEAMGATVSLVAGSRDNIKVTDPCDLAVARTLMGLQSPSVRVRAAR